MKPTIQKTLEKIEDLISHGSVSSAREPIIELCRRKIPRLHLARLAGLARRAYLPEKSVRLLHPIVRPAGTRKHDVPASDLEKAEYAAALTAVGASRESLAILASLDSKKLDLVPLFQGFSYVREWDLEKAIVSFEQVIALPGSRKLLRLRARVELAGLLIECEQYDRAYGLCEELLSLSSPDQFRTIHKETFWNLTHLFARKKEWGKANGYLLKLEELDRDEKDPLLQLIIRKWRALIQLAANNKDTRALEELRTVRELLRQERRWEDVRSCHFYDAVFRRRDDLLVHLYVGTPYPLFRERVLRELNGRMKIPEDYLWQVTSPGGAGKGERVLFDVATGSNSQTGATFKDGEAIQRLLQILCFDFYKPLQLSALHERLYPGQYFNPASSPDRVHQCVKRLRTWLQKNRIPLLIHEDMSFYRLGALRSCMLRVGKRVESEWIGVSPAELKLRGALAQVAKCHGQREFSAVEAAEILKVNARSSLRYLVEAIKLGIVERIVCGSTHRYRIR